MPPVIAAVANFIAVAASTVLGFAAGAQIYALAYYGISLFVLNRAAALFKPKAPRQSVSVTANYAGTDQPKRAIYGFLRVGGMDLHPPWTSGSDGRDLHNTYVLAYHEVDSFDSVFYDETEITNAQIGAITGAETDGRVTGGPFDVGVGATWIRRRRGTASEAVDFILNAAFPSSWGADMMGHGVALVYIRRRFNKEIWKSIPQPTFEVFGARCYDPRLDSTNGGAGAHRYADPTTWAWSANPFICAMHYMFALSWGPLVPTARINWASFAAAADVADALVAIPGAATQARYTFNGLIFAAQSYEDVINDFAEAGLGRITFHDGQYFASAGRFDTPTATIGEGDWVGALQVKFSEDRDQRWNAVTPVFYDKDNSYQRIPGYKRTNPNYETAFNGEQLPRVLDCPGCTDKYEAQRKAEMINRAGQNAVTVAGRLMPRLAGVSLFDTVYANYAAFGFVLKTFRVVTCTEMMDGSIAVVLREEQSADWADMVAGDYNTPSTVAVPVNSDPIPSVTNFATPAQFNSALAFTWDVTSNAYHSVTNYRIYRSTSNFPQTNGTIIFEGVGASRADLLANSYGPNFYWLSARVTSIEYILPNTLGLVNGPLHLDGDIIQDPEFQVLPASLSWKFIYAGVGQNSYWSFVASDALYLGQLARATVAPTNPADDANLTQTQFYRERVKASNYYQAELRWRKTNSLLATNTVTPGSLDPLISLYLYSANSDGSIADFPNTAQAKLPCSAQASSVWHLSRAIFKSSSDATLEWAQTRLVITGRGGAVDFDRLSIMPINSADPTSMFTTIF